MSLADNDILYKVAYDEAVRALSEQQGTIDSFRTRAGLLLSAAAITTSFLGAQALERGISNLAIWLAMGGFVGSPWSHWRFFGPAGGSSPQIRGT